MRSSAGLIALLAAALAIVATAAHGAEQNVPPVRLDSTGRHFERAGRPGRFLIWGLNYDHDAQGRLLEDYWTDEWAKVERDFRAMKALGANTVRIHLQIGRFLLSPRRANGAALRQLARLVRLAEDTGLYLDITGLGCYHRKDVPAWYAALGEQERWAAQAQFWASVARTCARSPAILCYDLMNEPILPNAGTPETDWLPGDFGGSTFVQRISLGLAGRTQQEVARLWLRRMVGAVRKVDRRHLITLGVIPWALTFPGAPPQFYSGAGDGLDYVSVHFYPERGAVPKALDALATYEMGRPIVVEEMFPLHCSIAELDAFVQGSRAVADGWIGFYWGQSIEEIGPAPATISEAITRGWLEYFRTGAGVALFGGTGK